MIDFKTCKMFDGNTWVWVVIETHENFDRLFERNQIQGFAWFLDDKGYNWVNINGYELINKRYKGNGDFTEEGFAWFKDDKGHGYINTLGLEFRSEKFEWHVDFHEKDYEINKKELLELKEKLLHDFPKGSMKYYILTKVLQ